MTDGNRDPLRHVTETATVGWRQSCQCPPHEPIHCVVLDPFGGAGTVGMVALQEGRSSILCELNPAYVELARQRIFPPAS